ncbi:hypothetical protein IT408_04320 [Candidatus Uhrbacteria bacterium]|nr:hypothetical protein [Candidatus Uhrbacteria bacterium]
MKHRLLITFGIIFTFIMLIGIVWFLRVRNTPEADFLPIKGTGIRNSTKPQEKKGVSNTGNSRDNGYVPVPYDQLPHGPPPQNPSVVIPTKLPVGQPILTPDGFVQSK